MGGGFGEAFGAVAGAVLEGPDGLADVVVVADVVEVAEGGGDAAAAAGSTEVEVGAIGDDDAHAVHVVGGRCAVDGGVAGVLGGDVDIEGCVVLGHAQEDALDGVVFGLVEGAVVAVEVE